MHTLQRYTPRPEPSSLPPSWRGESPLDMNRMLAPNPARTLYAVAETDGPGFSAGDMLVIEQGALPDSPDALVMYDDGGGFPTLRSLRDCTPAHVVGRVTFVIHPVTN